MNLIKFLRQQAEKDAASLLTEDDRKFIAQLIETSMKKDNEKKITITLSDDEVLTDVFDHGGDATDYDDAETVTEVEVKNK